MIRLMTAGFEGICSKIMDGVDAGLIAVQPFTQSLKT